MRIVDGVVDWLDERTGLKAPIVHMLTHPVPPGSRWAYVFGSATLTSLIVQLITGVALSTLYVPSAGDAYESLRYIQTMAPFGALVRGIHYFGASAMILFVGIHTIRVYLFGSYKYPRELNWVTGVVLLFTTVGMGFTGQILRWDQNAVWTVAVGSQQALRAPFLGKFLARILISGPGIGTSTLSHFFALHVFVLPGILLAVVALHLYLVLHHGISAPPKLGEPVDRKTEKAKYAEMLKREGVPFWPDAAWRDVVFSTIAVIGILVLAGLYGAPELQKPPDPSIVNAEPKPDWYLIWYFALLALLPHGAEDIVILGAPALAIVWLFAVPFVSSTGERSIQRRPWAIALVVFILGMVGALWLKGVYEVWTPKFFAMPLTAQVVGATSGPVYNGAQVFNRKGCLYCHAIAGYGGARGPDLSYVANRLTHDQLVTRVLNGGYNMPAYANNIDPKDLAALITFLESRKGVGGGQPLPDALTH